MPEKTNRPALEGSEPMEITSANNNSDYPNFSPETQAIVVTLAGDPQGKGRARAFMRSGHISHYTPEKTRSYEGMIRTAAMDAIGDRLPFDAPVKFDLKATFAVPASWSPRKRISALAGQIQPGKKPDLDNVAKAWNDALNGVAYRDDSLICEMTLSKAYGPAPSVTVSVELMGPAHELP